MLLFIEIEQKRMLDQDLIKVFIYILYFFGTVNLPFKTTT